MGSDENDERIARFFDDESKSMKNRHETDGLPNSAKVQVKHLKEVKGTVLDVGSGPGSVLIALLEAGVEKVRGVDLSEEMNKIAQERLKQQGYQDRAEIIRGNFLDVDIGEVNGVSIHRVLCCHPDRKGILDKTSRLRPHIISLTIPRDWLIMRAFVGLYSIFAEWRGIFRPYIHRQRDIDRMLEDEGYNIINRDKGWIWVTTTYEQPKIKGNEIVLDEDLGN